MEMLLYGGSGCGKSTYAEAIAGDMAGPRYYIATMRPYGEESLLRIARHQTMRAERGFITVERYTDLASIRLPQPGGVLLLECLCNLTANEMFDPDGCGPDNAVGHIMAGLDHLRCQCEHMILVSNEVGADALPNCYEPPVSAYIETLGHINRLLAASCDSVAELVCGIPLWLKGGPP